MPPAVSRLHPAGLLLSGHHFRVSQASLQDAGAADPVGAQLADPGFKNQSRAKFQIAPERITALEQAIDSFETELRPLRQFILAGGGNAGALLHVARTVCRRAERRVVHLSESVEVNPSVIEYLNRLSDFLFVLARVVNHREGKEEIPW